MGKWRETGLIHRGPDLAGQRFGRLMVVERIAWGAHGARYRCQCDCGGEIVREARQLKDPKTAGCTVCAAERGSANRTRHGEFVGLVPGTSSRIWRTWASMHARCTNPNTRSWPDYGGKGITVCEAWSDFEVFRDWALSHGYADDLTIERTDSHRGYEPRNCEWITGSENSRRAALQSAANRRFRAQMEMQVSKRPHFPSEMFWGYC